MAGRRRKARTLAFMALYEADMAGHDPQRVLDRLLAETPLDEENAQFARDLVDGVLAHRAEIDRLIQRKAPAWPLEQLSPVDRNLLRLAIYEVLFDNRVPVRAAINEAVELAKKFGSDSSPRFVNGVLGSVSLMVAR
ncbi:MAG: transcription antitermination factor NusB [Dehalococcoidia bacterium]|jgi:N utilization substance protein B|nr:transcription antitermination factor NusB [Dehalococcoidia bacterium]MDW8008618.1 transcription antitermination factor NusB [Chloroflexota bacterium]